MPYSYSFVCRGGLGNRLNCLANGITQAERRQRVPRAYWPLDSECGARFCDLGHVADTDCEIIIDEPPSPGMPYHMHHYLHAPRPCGQCPPSACEGWEDCYRVAYADFFRRRLEFSPPVQALAASVDFQAIGIGLHVRAMRTSLFQLPWEFQSGHCTPPDFIACDHAKIKARLLREFPLAAAISCELPTTDLGARSASALQAAAADFLVLSRAKFLYIAAPATRKYASTFFQPLVYGYQIPFVRFP